MKAVTHKILALRKKETKKKQGWTEVQLHHTFIPAISLILNQKVRDEEFPDCILRDQALVAKTLMESEQQKE